MWEFTLAEKILFGFISMVMVSGGVFSLIGGVVIFFYAVIIGKIVG